MREWDVLEKLGNCGKFKGHLPGLKINSTKGLGLPQAQVDSMGRMCILNL